MLDTLKSWLTELGTGTANKLLSAIIILVLGLLVIRLVMKLLKRTLEKSKLEKAAHSLITSLARVAMYTLLLLSAASALGIDVTGIVALASVLTYFASNILMVLIVKPLRPSLQLMFRGLNPKHLLSVTKMLKK